MIAKVAANGFMLYGYNMYVCIRTHNQTVYGNRSRPRVDGDLIPEDPEDLLSAGLFQTADLLSGTVPDEYSLEYGNCYVRILDDIFCLQDPEYMIG